MVGGTGGSGDGARVVGFVEARDVVADVKGVGRCPSLLTTQSDEGRAVRPSAQEEAGPGAPDHRRRQ